MSLEHHSKQLVKNSFYHLRNVAKLKPMLSKSDLELLIHAFISSRLDYCNSLFICLNKRSVQRLQLVQNSLLYSLHWLPVEFGIDFKLLLLVFRALHGQCPSYLSDLLHLYTPARSLRSSDLNLLQVPRTRFKTRGDLAFLSVAPKLWNALPLSLHQTDSVESFKSQFQTLLFKRAFSSYFIPI